jgi:hypothetical protein
LTLSYARTETCSIDGSAARAVDMSYTAWGHDEKVCKRGVLAFDLFINAIFTNHVLMYEKIEIASRFDIVIAHSRIL